VSWRRRAARRDGASLALPSTVNALRVADGSVRRVVGSLFAALALVALPGCCETRTVVIEPDAGEPEPELEVRIGMRRDARDNTFVPLDPGGDIHLGTFGQGGTHAELAVRCIGFGNRAFVTLTLENLRDGTVIMHPPTSRPQLLRCVEEPKGACDLLPIYFMTGGLAEPAEKDDLPVLVRASCLNEAGDQATASIDGVLRADEKAAAVGTEVDAGGGDAGAADEDAGATGL
jgi:hypothetical protein